MRLSDADLRAAADRLAADPGRWRRHVRHDPARRVFVEVERTADHSAWLICWLPGHDTGFHDHDGSAGAVVVLEGAVAEERLRLGAPPARRVVAAGEDFGFEATEIHRVEHAGDAPAVTLHVYSPPLGRMGAYRVEDDGLLRRELLEDGEELRPLAAASAS